MTQVGINERTSNNLYYKSWIKINFWLLSLTYLLWYINTSLIPFFLSSNNIHVIQFKNASCQISIHFSLFRHFPIKFWLKTSKTLVYKKNPGLPISIYSYLVLIQYKVMNKINEINENMWCFARFGIICTI